MDVRDDFQLIYSFLSSVNYQAERGIWLTSREAKMCGIKSESEDFNRFKYMYTVIGRSIQKTHRIVNRLERSIPGLTDKQGE